MAIAKSSRRGPKQSVRFDRDKLQRARAVADLTQEALAAGAEIGIDTVRRAEGGEPVLLETARAIGGCLNISFGDLLRPEKRPAPNAGMALQSNLGLRVTQSGWLGLTGFVSPYEHDYLCLLLQDCRVTNRSSIQPISLGMTLQGGLHGADKASVLTLDAEVQGPGGARVGDIGFLADAAKQLAQQGIKPPCYLRFPLDLRPGQTVAGQVGFLISSLIWQKLPEPWENIFLRSQRVTIRDYITNDTLSMEIPCEHPSASSGTAG